MSRITFDILRAFGGKWRGIVYVDGFQVATKTFATYNEAFAWCCNEQSAREREVKER